jgi:hypothetical protein
MFSNQPESGLIMIEKIFLPGIGRVTLLTLGSQDPLVFILFPMASDTGHGDGFKIVRLMAGFAPHLLVFSFQGKSCFGMVKTDLLPGVRIMTPFALFA